MLAWLGLSLAFLSFSMRIPCILEDEKHVEQIWTQPTAQAKPRQAQPTTADASQLQVCKREIRACFCMPVRFGVYLLCNDIVAHVD